MRERIAEVPGLLPEGKVTKDSCDTRLDPKFDYTALTLTGDLPSTGNAEVMTTSQIEQPDTLVNTHDDFAFAGSVLLSSIRVTGDKGPLGSGEFAFEDVFVDSSDEDSTDLWKSFLEKGLETRYLVALRVRGFQSPGMGSREFYGEVRLDAFVVDLEDMEVACGMHAGYDFADETVIEYPQDEELELSMYRLMQKAVGKELSAKLADHTGGSADVPPTEGAVCNWMGSTVTRTENVCL